MEHIYSIGEAAVITGISVQSLRKYSNMGLVTPEHVDRDSGYRYYSMNQLHLLDKIKYFRELGVPLAEIKHALEARDSSVLREILEAQRERLRREIEEAEAAMEIADWYLEYLQYPERRASVHAPYLQHFPHRYALAVSVPSAVNEKGSGKIPKPSACAPFGEEILSRPQNEAENANGRLDNNQDSRPDNTENIHAAETELARIRHSEDGRKLRYLRQFGYVLDRQKLGGGIFAPTAEFMFIKGLPENSGLRPEFQKHLLHFPAGDYLCFFADKNLQPDFPLAPHLEKAPVWALAIEYAGTLRDYGSNLLCEYQLYLGD